MIKFQTFSGPVSLGCDLHKYFSTGIAFFFFFPLNETGRVGMWGLLIEREKCPSPARKRQNKIFSPRKQACVMENVLSVFHVDY